MTGGTMNQGGHIDAQQPAAVPTHRALELWVPALLFAVCLAAQLYLVFFKSFNWDEFLHFNQVYQLRAGTLIEPFQMIHLRALGWAPKLTIREGIIRTLDYLRANSWLLDARA